MKSLSIDKIKGLLELEAEEERKYYEFFEVEKEIVFGKLIFFAYATAYVTYKEEPQTYDYPRSFETSVELTNFELKFGDI